MDLLHRVKWAGCNFPAFNHDWSPVHSSACDEFPGRAQGNRAFHLEHPNFPRTPPGGGWNIMLIKAMAGCCNVSSKLSGFPRGMMNMDSWLVPSILWTLNQHFALVLRFQFGPPKLSDQRRQAKGWRFCYDLACINLLSFLDLGYL